MRPSRTHRLRNALATTAVAALSALICASLISYLVFAPEPALAFGNPTKQPPTSNSATVLYGTITDTDNKPLPATIAAIACQPTPRGPETKQVSNPAPKPRDTNRDEDDRRGEDNKDSPFGLRCATTQTAANQDGSWRLQLTTCTDRRPCTIQLTIRTTTPKATATTTLTTQPGTTTRIDARLTERKHPLINWNPGGTY